MSEENVSNAEAQDNMQAEERQADVATDPLEDAWRLSTCCRTLAFQAATCFVVMLILLGGLGLCRAIDSRPWSLIVLAVTLFLAFIAAILSSVTVMTVASQEAAGEKSCVCAAVMRALLPATVVALFCSVLIVMLSMVCHVVPALLITLKGDAAWVGQLIFALAVVPMFFIALVELILVVAAVYIFTPALVEEKMSPLRAVSVYIDTLLACHCRDLCQRVRAFVMSALIALPILAAMTICCYVIRGIVCGVGASVASLFVSSNGLVVVVMWISTLAVVALATALPKAYLNSACLLIHRSARD